MLDKVPLNSMTTDFASASALVTKLSADPQNGPLLTHLTQVLQQLVRDKPQDALACFEQLSTQVKQLQHQATDTKSASPPASSLEKSIVSLLHSSSNESINQSLASHLTASESTCHHFINKSEAELASDADAEIGQLNIPEHVPNLVHLFSLLREAGVAVSAAEALTLQSSIEQFASRHESVEQVKFWGKIFVAPTSAATASASSQCGNAYYIIETRYSALDEVSEELTALEEKVQLLLDEDEGEPPLTVAQQLDAARLEPLGAAGTVNEFVYYATMTPLLAQSWTLLPLLTPKQVQSSRRVKRFLTGDLKAEVAGLPRFPWSEAHLLRARIARISHATLVAPKGAFTPDEADPQAIVPNEQWTGDKHSSELLSPSAWVHARLRLLRQGRVDNFIDEITQHENESEEAEAARVKQEEAAKEKIVPACQSLSEDKRGSKQKSKAWTFRLSSPIDTGLYPSKQPQPDDAEASAAPQPTSHTVASAHSLHWPGAVTAAKSAQYVSVYVGYGLPHRVKRVAPPCIPALQSEWNAAPLEEQADALKPPKKEKVVKPKDEDGTDEEATEDEEESEDEAKKDKTDANASEDEQVSESEVDEEA